MTSAAYKSAGAGGRHAEGRGFGLIVFAAVLLGLVGCFNLIDGTTSNITKRSRHKGLVCNPMMGICP